MYLYCTCTLRRQQDHLDSSSMKSSLGVTNKVNQSSAGCSNLTERSVFETRRDYTWQMTKPRKAEVSYELGVYLLTWGSFAADERIIYISVEINWPNIQDLQSHARNITGCFRKCAEWQATKKSSKKPATNLSYISMRRDRTSHLNNSRQLNGQRMPLSLSKTELNSRKEIDDGWEKCEWGYAK